MNARGWTWRLGMAGVVALTLTACEGTTDLTGPTQGLSLDPESLIGLWELTELESSDEGAVRVEPGTFTAEFAGSEVYLKADCNRCRAGYTAGEGSLDVGLLACTLAYCPSAPLDTTFTQLMSAAKGWEVDGGRLVVTSGEGVLIFVR